MPCGTIDGKAEAQNVIGLKTRSVARTLTKLRISRPAETSSTTVKAISAEMRRSRSRECDAGPGWRLAETCDAGAIETANAAAAERAIVNSRTGR